MQQGSFGFLRGEDGLGDGGGCCVCAWRDRACILFGRGRGGGGGVADSCIPIGINRGQGAQLQAIDVSENGSPTSGDLIGGEEPVEVVERMVDALGGLKALATVGKRRIDVGVLQLLELGVVVRAES